MSWVKLASAIILGGIACSIRAEGPVEPDYPCYGETSDGKAWTENTAGKPELVVTGTVVTPTGNNRLALVLGPSTSKDPPEQYVDLQILGLGNIATLIVETRTVTGRFPVPARYGDIVITCSGDEVGRIEGPGAG